MTFQMCPGVGAEASVPAVPQYRFWYLGSCSYFFFIPVPFRLQIWWKPKLLNWNLSWLEPKLLKIYNTKIQKLQFFRFFRFRPTLFYTQQRGIFTCQYCFNSDNIPIMNGLANPGFLKNSKKTVFICSTQTKFYTPRLSFQWN